MSLGRRATDLAFGVAYTLSRARGDADSEDSTSSEAQRILQLGMKVMF